MICRGATLICASLVAAALLLAGCGGSDDDTSNRKPTNTPAATATPPAVNGPQVTFFGLTRADGTLLAPTTTDSNGVAVYSRTSGSGFALIVEGAPGPSALAVGMSAYQSDGTRFPDLQIEVSRALGNGSAAVCDIARPTPGATPAIGGGVPAIDPLSFDATQPNINTINDLACRFRDGAGNPVGVPRTEACVLFPSGDYDFVVATSEIQFCGFITRTESFPDGDTMVTVRLRDTGGNVGSPAQLIVRVLPEPTPPPPTAHPTETPSTAGGPVVSFFGVARADNMLIESTESTVDGIPIFTRSSGSEFSLVVEGRPGGSGVPVSPSAYQSNLVTFPDLQIQVDRPLGNGSAAVCDLSQPGSEAGGGVPAIDPPSFDLTQGNIASVNDLACRFRDGAGNPIGRERNDACVLFSSGEFGFVNPASSIQFCGFIDSVLAFPRGETLVTVRLRDVGGVVGPPEQLIVRVAPPP